MLSHEEEMAALVRHLRKRPILSADDAATPVAYGAADIECLIPHRPPMLLVGNLVAIDIRGRRIRGAVTLDPADPVFGGHFPGQPLYPGVLQVEAMGQLALCLMAFLRNNTTEIPPANGGVRAVAAKIIHSEYIEPLLPNDTLTLLAGVVAEDEWTATASGQIVKHGRVASLAVQEVYFVA